MTLENSSEINNKMEKYPLQFKEIIKRASKDESMLRISNEYINFNNEVGEFGGPIGICGYIINNIDNF